MATTALQIDALWSGLNDPDTGQSYSGAIVAFFEAGTTTPKAVWLDKDKTLPTVAGQAQDTLSSNGVLKVFGDGAYKINVYAPTDAGLTTPLSGSIDGAEYIPLSEAIEDVMESIAPVDSIADLRAITYTPEDGQVIKVLGYDAKTENRDWSFQWVASNTETDDNGMIIKVTAITTGRWKRLYSGAVNSLFFGVADIGLSINRGTAAGYLYQEIPAGEYTQSTALTQNQEVHLSAAGWNGHYGFNPVAIVKDDDFAHLESTVTFSSYGITWSGLGVVGTSHGLIMHSKFEFWGLIISQPGNGLYVLESSASHNSNGSIIAGGFGSNGGSGIVFENTVVTDSENIDLNDITIKSGTRCNSNGVDGITMKAGLWHEWTNVRCDNNGAYGVHFDCDNVVTSGIFQIYAENNGTADIFVTENAPNNFKDNTFNQGRGFTGADIITSQGNILVNSANYQGMIANLYQPWVHALLSASASDVTGNGTVYTVPFDSEIKDIQGEYAVPTYTAKLAGSKRVTGNIYCQNVTALHTTAVVEVVTTNRSYSVAQLNLGAIRDAANNAVIPFGATVDMSANDTLTVTLRVTGAASDDLDLLGNASTAATYLSITSD